MIEQPTPDAEPMLENRESIPPEAVQEASDPSRPQLLQLVPIRQAFPREADLERLLVEELENDDSTLADLLGLDVDHVVTQQQTAGMRPDILVYQVDKSGPRCEAVIEITLELLDIDHLRRTFTYAIENQTASGLTPASWST